MNARDILAARLEGELAALRASVNPTPAHFCAVRVAESDVYYHAIGVPPQRHQSRSAYRCTAGEALEHLIANSGRIVAYELATIEAIGALFVADATLRSAVVEELARVWPWTATEEAHFRPTRQEGTSPLPMLMLGLLMARDGSVASTQSWPTSVALADAVQWIGDALNGQSNRLADTYRVACRVASIADARRGSSCAVVTPIAQARPQPLTLQIESPDALFAPAVDGGVPVTGQQLAWAYAAYVAVERRREQKAFRLPARRHSSAAITSVATLTSTNASTHWSDKMTIIDRSVCLTYYGRREPLQLHLFDEGDCALTEELARALVSKLGEDGLRDYLTTFALASDEGNSGQLRWTWAQHREIAGYGGRVARESAQDNSLRRATYSNLTFLHRAELHAEQILREKSGKETRDWKRLGDCGLIAIEGGRMVDDLAAVLLIRQNSYLYRCARAGAKQPYFTLVPTHVLADLGAGELRCYTSIQFAARGSSNSDRSGAQLGVVEMRARRLWDSLGFDACRIRKRKRWPALRATAERKLEHIARVTGMDIRGGGEGPDAVYTLTQPWYRDRLAHRVPPALSGGSIAGVPRTGAELRAARESKGLNLRQLAKATGISRSTLHRVERQESPLPFEWIMKFAAVGVRNGSRGP